METSACRRLGRPRGRQHDATIQLRLPRPALTLLRSLAAREGLRVAQLIRAAIEGKLAAVAEQCGSVGRDVRRSGRTRVQALEVLRLCALAGLYLSPAGLKLARAEAAGLLPDPSNDTLEGYGFAVHGAASEASPTATAGRFATDSPKRG